MLSARLIESALGSDRAGQRPSGPYAQDSDMWLPTAKVLIRQGAIAVRISLKMLLCGKARPQQVRAGQRALAVRSAFICCVALLPPNNLGRETGPAHICAEPTRLPAFYMGGALSNHTAQLGRELHRLHIRLPVCKILLLQKFMQW